ncbi:hypothetical protein Avbf_06932 [Armadillidium vulgare]|nr:hypothetical protein Avbf_06932 [Armadillidium vulgare]
MNSHRYHEEFGCSFQKWVPAELSSIWICCHIILFSQLSYQVHSYLYSCRRLYWNNPDIAKGFLLVSNSLSIFQRKSQRSEKENIFSKGSSYFDIPIFGHK